MKLIVVVAVDKLPRVVSFAMQVIVNEASYPVAEGVYVNLLPVIAIPVVEETV